MEKLIKQVVRICCLTLVGLSLFSLELSATESNECNTYFIELPFLQSDISTKDQRVRISIIDKSPLTIHSIKDSDSYSWSVTISSKKDTAEVLSNLITKSELSMSMDASLYVLVSLILPEVSKLENVNSQKEAYRFYELLFDVFGMKDIQISITDIWQHNQKLLSLLYLWSQEGMSKAYSEISDLIEMINKRKDLSSVHKIMTDAKKWSVWAQFVEDNSYDREWYFSFLGRLERLVHPWIFLQDLVLDYKVDEKPVILNDIVRKEISSEDYDIIPEELTQMLMESNKFKYLKQIIPFDKALMATFSCVGYQQGILDALIWEQYLYNLKEKTMEELDRMVHLSTKLVISLFGTKDNSRFWKDRIKGSSRRIFRMIGRFIDIQSSVNKFDISKIIKDKKLSSKEIYQGLKPRVLPKIPEAAQRQYRPYVDDIILIAPVWGLVEELYLSLKKTYDKNFKDLSDSSRIYDYYTNFSHLQSEKYKKYLSDKYGEELVQALLYSLL